MSGHRNNPTERGALTAWKRHREKQIRTQKESDPERGTHMLETAWEGHVRTQKESERKRGPHVLDTSWGETSQDTERIRSSEGHSHTEHGMGRDKSRHGKNQTERGALTT